MNAGDILRHLAETLSVAETLRRFPELDEAGLRAVLEDAAQGAETATGPETDVDFIEYGPPSPGLRLSLYTDGGSRGNPGPSGAGAVAYDDQGRPVGQWKKFLGRMTNNQAEYHALLLGLERISLLKPSHVTTNLDSELVVLQILGKYRVKNKALKPLYERVMERLESLDGYEVRHVRRMFNAEADRLANEAMDSYG